MEIKREHDWLPVGKDGVRWCQDCGCLSAVSDGVRFYFLVAAAAGAKRMDHEPPCHGHADFVDVLQRLLLYAEHSDEYAQAAHDARQLMAKGK